MTLSLFLFLCLRLSLSLSVCLPACLPACLSLSLSLSLLLISCPRKKLPGALLRVSRSCTFDLWSIRRQASTRQQRALSVWRQSQSKTTGVFSQFGGKLPAGQHFSHRHNNGNDQSAAFSFASAATTAAAATNILRSLLIFCLLFLLLSQSY